MLSVNVCVCVWQGQPEEKRTKANGTKFSALETFSEHAYTLPLLAACRLACASFRMDPAASSSSLSSTTSSTTTTFLKHLDWLLSLSSLVVLSVLMFTLPYNDSTATWVSERWAQWLLFLLLAFTHLTQVRWRHAHTCMIKEGACGLIGFDFQDSFVAFSRPVDALVRGGILIAGCAAFDYALGEVEPRGNKGAMKNTVFEFYPLRTWASSNRNAQVALQFWAGLVACR